MPSSRVISITEFSPVPPPVVPPVPEYTPGYIFFTPALESNDGVQIDVSLVSITAKAEDTYQNGIYEVPSRLPFVLGPAPSVPSGRAWPPDFSPSYEPQLNNVLFGLSNSSRSYSGGGSTGSIHGVLYNTVTHVTTLIDL